MESKITFKETASEAAKAIYNLFAFMKRSVLSRHLTKKHNQPRSNHDGNRAFNYAGCCGGIFLIGSMACVDVHVQK